MLNIGVLSLCIRRQPWAPPAPPAGSGGGGLALARVPRRPLQRAVRMTDRKPSRLHPLQRTTHLNSNCNSRRAGPRLRRRGSRKLLSPRLLLSPVQPGTTWRPASATRKAQGALRRYVPAHFDGPCATRGAQPTPSTCSPPCPTISPPTRPSGIRCACRTVQAKPPAGPAHAVGAGGPTLAAQRPPVRPPPALSPPLPSLAGAERM